ncbi:hypothetical protein GCK32_005460 [Trichostrongylus colubriformis]|uniref:Uncharacterized protein n=1 Tax=Trichostrongylus colubriformis TaxID=6319 RepID=A0AAN8J220_TRICO
MKAQRQRNENLRVLVASRLHSTIVTRDRVEWRRYWCRSSLLMDNGTTDDRATMHFVLLILLIGLTETFTPPHPLLNIIDTSSNQVMENVQKQPLSEYVLQYVVDPLINTTGQEKQEIVTLVDNAINGQYASTNITTFEQLLEFIQKEAPNFFGNLSVMYNAFIQKVKALNNEANEFLEKWMDEWAKTVISIIKNNNRHEIFDFYRQFFAAAKNLSESAVNSLKYQFPDYADIWAQCDQLRELAESLANRTDTSGDCSPCKQFQHRIRW